MSATDRVVTPGVLRALTIDTEPRLSCDHCFARMDEYVERRLREPGHHDAKMDTHLAACGACEEEVRSLHDLLVEDGAQ
jgi:hypothetical protein